MKFKRAEVMHNCFDKNPKFNYLCVIADIKNVNVLGILFFLIKRFWKNKGKRSYY